MIEINEIETEYPKSYNLFKDFLFKECSDNYSHSAIIYFLDTHKLFINIITDFNGSNYLVELNGLMIDSFENRIDAEKYAIKQMLKILENTS